MNHPEQQPDATKPAKSRAPGCLSVLGYVALGVLFVIGLIGLIGKVPDAWAAVKNWDEINRLGLWILTAAIVHAVCSRRKERR